MSGKGCSDESGKTECEREDVQMKRKGERGETYSKRKIIMQKTDIRGVVLLNDSESTRSSTPLSRVFLHLRWPILSKRGE